MKKPLVLVLVLLLVLENVRKTNNQDEGQRPFE